MPISSQRICAEVSFRQFFSAQHQRRFGSACPGITSPEIASRGIRQKFDAKSMSGPSEKRASAMSVSFQGRQGEEEEEAEEEKEEEELVNGEGKGVSLPV